MSNTPAVIIKSQFQLNEKSASLGGEKSSFNNYLNYMDRPNTHLEKNQFENYQDYMSNDEKSTGLFTNEKDKLDKIEKEKIKEIFKHSQEKGSILWQDVISFDNDWLKEVGVLDKHTIDEKKLQQASRNAVNEMLKKEDMLDSALWTGAIHYNTDNIHIHIAIVQTKNFRERGKRKPKSIETMKSKVVNSILDRSKENAKLNEFIREKVINTKRDDNLLSLKNRIVNRDMVKQFKNIHSMLPDDKRMWKYNMNGISHVKPEIDKLTSMYIDKHLKKEYQGFLKQLDKEVNLFKKTYGDTEKAEKFRDTKIKDLYTRMGNTILKEVKEFDKSQNNVTRKSEGKFQKTNFEMQRDMNNFMYRMNRGMNDNLQHYKNQNAYERLQREQEMER
ncbi:MAG: MobP2 family relaxase [Bacillaceae bacterium]